MDTTTVAVAVWALKELGHGEVPEDYTPRQIVDKLVVELQDRLRRDFGSRPGDRPRGRRELRFPAIAASPFEPSRPSSRTVLDGFSALPTAASRKRVLAALEGRKPASLISVAELSQMLGISEGTVRRHLKYGPPKRARSGDIRMITMRRVGGRIMFVRKSVEAFIYGDD